MESVDDFTLGDTAYDNGNYAEALRFFLKAAEQGDCDAMCRVASMAESDPDQSIYWDQRAIAAGSKTSLLNLGITYRRLGKITEAKSWFEKSLATGDGEAAIELARLYSVSEKEIARVKNLLEVAIASDNLTLDSLDEARRWLSQLSEG